MTTRISAIIFFIITLSITAWQTSTVQATDTITSISIPVIGVNVPIYPLYITEDAYGEVTWDTSELRMSAGHLTGLAWFGEQGNVAVGGHATSPDGQPDVFYALPNLRVGDVIDVTTGGTVYRYQIISTSNVDRYDLSILSQTIGTEMLTLFTCDTGSGYQNGDYGRRHVVQAVRIG
ncbi:MAG: sortase [Aggregatilineales bacterium]